MLQDIPTSFVAARAEIAAGIETDRLLLRRPTLADVPAIARLANDGRIAEMTRLPHPYRVEHAASFVATLATMPHEAGPVWLIEYLSEPVGVVGLALDDLPQVALGYWLGVAHWGRGFATEAARAAIAALFETCDIPELKATARVANPASQNVLEKCGFVWSGCILQRSDLLGYSVPVDCFRLTREAWAGAAT